MDCTASMLLGEVCIMFGPLVGLWQVAAPCCKVKRIEGSVGSI
jgi:hypothetical protein